MNLAEHYKGKKVFLTGHTGFKGAWMLAILNHWGAEVRGYALDPEYEDSLYDLINGDSLCDSVIADIRDADHLADEIRIFEPDYVFHLAAQPLVLDSYEDPLYTYETNVMGTAYVLDALRSLENPCTSVIITTDKVYENMERQEPYSEDERLGGFDPYSNSKACAELVTSSYMRSFFPIDKYDEHKQAIATARSGNVIGGGDWSDFRIIPDTIKALMNKEAVVLRNPNSVRPWQHVLDPLYGYLLLGARLAEDPAKYSSAYNFGPRVDDTLTVEELVREAIRAYGEGEYRIEGNPNQPHEAGLLKLSIDKAADELNWKPRLSSVEAVEWTVNWYRDFKNNPTEVTKQQIERYFSAI